tara:strand:+ start:3593 stop:4054 length:462 start_codon:yes stop_codon:yes gene_type:complete
MNKNKILPTKIVEIEVSKWNTSRMVNLDKRRIEKFKSKGSIPSDLSYHLIVNDDFEFEGGENQLSFDQMTYHLIMNTGGYIPIDHKQGRIINIPRDIGMEIYNKGEDYLKNLERLGNGDIKVGIEIDHKVKNSKDEIVLVNIDPKTREVKVGK